MVTQDGYQSKFAPVVSGIPAGIAGASKKDFEEGYTAPNGKKIKFTWWEADSPLQHSHMLMSAYYGIAHSKGLARKGLDGTLKQLSRIPDNVVVIGDSGGFQLATFEMKGKPCNIKALDVLQWQEKHCDIGLCLDFPPHAGKVYATKEVFERKAQVLYDNNVIYANNRKNSKMMIYNVLHGGSLEEFETWYKKVSTFDFEGWAVAVKPSHAPMLVAFGMMFLYSKGIRANVHMLGTTGVASVALLAYVSRFMKNITYDSITYATGTKYGLYQAPMWLTPKFLSFGKKGGNDKLKLPPCLCPVCSNVTLDILRDSKQGGVLLNLHNLYWTVQYDAYVNSIKDDKELFHKFVREFCSADTLHAIEFVDLCVEQGFDVAYNKYKHHVDLFRFKPRDEDQMTLFNEEEVDYETEVPQE